MKSWADASDDDVPAPTIKISQSILDKIEKEKKENANKKKTAKTQEQKAPVPTRPPAVKTSAPPPRAPPLREERMPTVAVGNRWTKASSGGNSGAQARDSGLRPGVEVAHGGWAARAAEARKKNQQQQMERQRASFHSNSDRSSHRHNTNRWASNEDSNTSWRKREPAVPSPVKPAVVSIAKKKEPVEEKGVVEAIKDTFGFISCVSKDIQNDLYFLLTDADTTLSVGDCVSFNITKKPSQQKDKLSAVKVKKLQDGALDDFLYEKIHQNTKALIVREPKAMKPGQLVLSWDEESLRDDVEGKDLYSFTVKEIKGGAQLKRGDVVSCNIVKVKRSGKTQAQNLSLLEPLSKRLSNLTEALCSQSPSRYLGVVQKIVDEKSCMVLCCEKVVGGESEQEGEEWEEKNSVIRCYEKMMRDGWREDRLKVGVVLEFNIVKDVFNESGKMAAKVEISNKKIIIKDTIIFKKVFGILSTPSKITIIEELNKSEDNTSTEDASDLPEAVSYNVSSFLGVRPRARDTVVFSIVARAGNKEDLEAKDIVLYCPREEIERRKNLFLSELGLVDRVVGVVTGVRDSFGFITWQGKTVYFKYEEVVRAPMTLAIQSGASEKDLAQLKRKSPIPLNSTVSFAVTKVPQGRFTATRVLKIQPDPRLKGNFIMLESDITGVFCENNRVKYNPKEFIYPELLTDLSKIKSDEIIQYTLLSKNVKNKKNNTGGTVGQSTDKKVIQKSVDVRVKDLVRLYSQWLGLKTYVLKNETTGKPMGLCVELGEEKAKDVDSIVSSIALSGKYNGFAVNDEVKFSVAFDRKNKKLVGIKLRLLNPKVEPRRDGAVIGVIAKVDEKGFGFIQSCEGVDKIYFRIDMCNKLTFPDAPKVGDFVEFFIQQAAPRGRAVDINFITKESFYSDHSESAELLNGIITKLPYKKQSTESTICQKLLFFQNYPRNFGEITVGESLIESNKVSTKNKKDAQSLDWNREKELRQLISKFSESEKETEEITGLNDSEKNVVLKEIRKCGFCVFNKGGRLIVARKEESLDVYKESVKEEEVEKVDEVTEKKKIEKFYFSPFDIAENEWTPALNDKVSFKLTTVQTSEEKASAKKVFCTSILCTEKKKPVDKKRGFIDGTVKKYGFVRPKESVSQFENVDESFKPGFGGRDGTVVFEISEIVGGIRLFDGDEVEFHLEGSGSELRAKQIKLLIRKEHEKSQTITERPKYNSKLLLSTHLANNGAMRFHQAKRPDGTKGFPAGRGRSIVTKPKLNVTANVFTPSFIAG